MKKINLAGRRFGKVQVIDQAPNRGTTTMWNCRCDCGKEYVACSSNLRRKNTKSCGCDRNAKHMMCGSPIYKLWSNIKSRTTNKNATRYERYGGRGIKVCDEWINSFDSFMKWCNENGYAEGLQIDRIDNDGDYCPENCRFVTNLENSKNRKMTNDHYRAFDVNRRVRWRKITNSNGDKFDTIKSAGESIGMTGGAISYAIKNMKKTKGVYWYG